MTYCLNRKNESQKYNVWTDGITKPYRYLSSNGLFPVGAKPLLEPIIIHFQLDPYELAAAKL